MTKPARLRTFWWTLHRWIGLGLTVLLVPIAVSGALLVWHDPLDAVTSSQPLRGDGHAAHATLGLSGERHRGA